MPDKVYIVYRVLWSDKTPKDMHTIDDIVAVYWDAESLVKFLDKEPQMYRFKSFDVNEWK